MDQAAGPFADRIALVTGGASGIGRALCLELGRRGAVVVVTDVDEAGARAASAEIAQAGGRAEALRLDVTRAEEVQGAVDGVAARHGRLDLLFNNAGLGLGGEVRDLTLEHWRRIVDVNLWGVIHGVAAAYPVMVRQGGGHIVNVASLAGLVGYPTAAPYATTKMAVVGLSLSLRVEAEALGVRVSAVCPGFVKSAIFDRGTFVGVDSADLVARLPFALVESDDAARRILRGVARNQAVIAFPFYARLLWALHRVHPALSSLVGRKIVRDFRAVRRPAPAQGEGR
jgi:NAD(P)-dependent dehydrogenase (short-subunit alcohol dehydrogenase family)